MSGSAGEVVALLRQAIEHLDRAAATAMRAQADADQAHARYAEAARGTNHSRIRQATDESRTASEKAGKVARLLAEAATHLANYSNLIDPGSGPVRLASDQAKPSGEELVQEAERRARRADAAWRKQVRQAGDTEDTLKNAESGGRAVFNHFKRQPKPPGGTSAGTTAPLPEPALERPNLDHPVTAVVMAAGALAVATKSIWNHFRNRQPRKRNDDHQT